MHESMVSIVQLEMGLPFGNLPISLKNKIPRNVLLWTAILKEREEMIEDSIGCPFINLTIISNLYWIKYLSFWKHFLCFQYTNAYEIANS